LVGKDLGGRKAPGSRSRYRCAYGSGSPPIRRPLLRARPCARTTSSAPKPGSAVRSTSPTVTHQRHAHAQQQRDQPRLVLHRAGEARRAVPITTASGSTIMMVAVQPPLPNVSTQIMMGSIASPPPAGGPIAVGIEGAIGDAGAEGEDPLAIARACRSGAARVT
jgi:hypothetical protein